MKRRGGRPYWHVVAYDRDEREIFSAMYRSASAAEAERRVWQLAEDPDAIHQIDVQRASDPDARCGAEGCPNMRASEDARMCAECAHAEAEWLIGD